MGRVEWLNGIRQNLNFFSRNAKVDSTIQPFNPFNLFNHSTLINHDNINIFFSFQDRPFDFRYAGLIPLTTTFIIFILLWLSIMPRRPSGKIDVCLRIKADLYQRLKEIAKAEGCSIADLVEPKLIELVALYEAGVPIRRGWDLNPRTLSGRGSRVPRSSGLCNPGSIIFYV